MIILFLSDYFNKKKPDEMLTEGEIVLYRGWMLSEDEYQL